MILVRRVTWRRCDRKGRAYAAFNGFMAVFNITFGIVNLKLGAWWITIFQFALGLVYIKAAFMSLQSGMLRAMARWVYEDQQRKEQWKWN